MSLSNLADAFQTIIISFKDNLPLVTFWLAVFWVVQIINRLLGYRLNFLGIYPRTIHGLFGIVFTPFLHRDFHHLFFNSIPLFILANLVLLQGVNQFYSISLLIICLSGLAIWLFGKRGIHIGASSLIMGYFGYLLANAYQQFTVTSIILAIIALYYFAGLFLALVPSGRKDVSWSGHVFGFLAGLAVAYFPIVF